MAEMAEGDPLSPGVVEELAASATAFLTELDRVTFDLRRSVRVTWSEDVAPKLGKLSDATLRDKLNDWGTSIEMANLALLDRMRITLPTAAAILDKAALLEETFETGQLFARQISAKLSDPGVDRDQIGSLQNEFTNCSNSMRQHWEEIRQEHILLKDLLRDLGTGKEEHRDEPTAQILSLRQPDRPPLAPELPPARRDHAAEYAKRVANGSPPAGCGELVVAAVLDDIALGRRHGPINASDMDIAGRRDLTTLIASWYAMDQEFAIKLNLSRVLRLLGFPAQRMGRLDGSFVVEPVAARLAKTKVSGRAGPGLFGAHLGPLAFDEEIEADVVLYWGEGKGIVDVLDRLPGTGPVLLLVFATLDEPEWRAIEATKVTVGPRIVVDQGFIWHLAGRHHLIADIAPPIPAEATMTPVGAVIDFPERRRTVDIPSAEEPSRAIDIARTPISSAASTLPTASELAALAAELGIDFTAAEGPETRRCLANDRLMWSPLTREQESSLVEGFARVTVIFGSTASGLRIVPAALRALPAARVREFGGNLTVRQWLPAQARKTEPGELAIALIPAKVAWTPQTIEAAITVTEQMRRSKPNFRVVFLGTSSSEFQSGVAARAHGRPLTVLHLGRLHRDERSRWLAAVHREIGISKDVLTEAADKLGRWPGLLAAALKRWRGGATDIGPELAKDHLSEALGLTSRLSDLLLSAIDGVDNDAAAFGEERDVGPVRRMLDADVDAALRWATSTDLLQITDGRLEFDRIAWRALNR
jgi:hypothetical protein